MTSNTLRIQLLAVGLTFLTGCGVHFELTKPQDFVKLDETSLSYRERATNAHGVVLAVREVENHPEGNLTFWVDAVRNQVRMLGGYALIEEKSVRSQNGQHGRLLRFGRDEHGAAFHYWVAVFVTNSRVFILEMGGRREKFEEVRPQMEKTLASFKVS